MSKQKQKSEKGSGKSARNATAKRPPCRLPQRRFFKEHKISEAAYRRSDLDWNSLTWIYWKHNKQTEALELVARDFVDRLRCVRAIHSVRYRVKNPENLVAKVIRKCLADPDLEITPENFATEITDLIGIRALHLYKDDWIPIHQFIDETWTIQGKPVANIRDGDPADIQGVFEEQGCEVRKRDFGYRSVHYLLKTQPTREKHVAELQVRTVFEEAWSEIDHDIRYPRGADDPVVEQFLVIFNRLVGQADEMGTFIKRLQGGLAEQSAKYATALEELAVKEEELQETVSKLNLTAKQKRELESRIAEYKSSLDPGRLGSRVRGTIGDPSLISYDPSLATYATDSVSSVFFVAKTRYCTSCGKSFEETGLISETKCPSCRDFTWIAGENS